MKKTMRRSGDLHNEHQVLISYLTSRTSPDKIAQMLYSVLLLASDRNAPDVVTTIRCCLEDASIRREVKTLFRKEAAEIEGSYDCLTGYHMDVKYSLAGRTNYDEDEQEWAIKLLDALNNFCTAVDTFDRMTGQRPASVDGSVLGEIPRVIRRLGYANPEERLSRQPTRQLKELIERSKAITDTDSTLRDNPFCGRNQLELNRFLLPHA